MGGGGRVIHECSRMRVDVTSQSREPKFEFSARVRQGDFRDSSDTISAAGRTPSDDKGSRHKHLLALGQEEENLYPAIRGAEGALRFFRERNIKWWKSSRSGDNSKVDGPTRNMASSQVACVNFLLPLIEIPSAMPAEPQAIDADVCGIADIHHQANASPIEFEWIGLDRSLEGGRTRGSQTTSIDAFMVAETAAGLRRAYLLEWKYVEQYFRTKPDFKGDGKAGETRRQRYSPYYYRDASSFNPVTAPEMEDFFYEPLYQIMRQRLLADRMVQNRELGVSEAKVVVVVPEENLSYRETITSPTLKERFPELKMVEQIMLATLRRPKDQFAMVAPYTLVNAVVGATDGMADHWASYWRERYGV